MCALVALSSLRIWLINVKVFFVALLAFAVNKHVPKFTHTQIYSHFSEVMRYQLIKSRLCATRAELYQTIYCDA